MRSERGEKLEKKGKEKIAPGKMRKIQTQEMHAAGLLNEQFLTEGEKSIAGLLKKAWLQVTPKKPLSEDFKSVVVELVKSADPSFFTVLLASNLESIKDILEICDAQQETLLMIAVRSKNPDMVREIRAALETEEMTNQFPPKWLITKNSQGKTALDIAEEIGDSNILELLTYQDNPKSPPPKKSRRLRREALAFFSAPARESEKKSVRHPRITDSKKLEKKSVRPPLKLQTPTRFKVKERKAPLNLPLAPDIFSIIEEDNVQIFDKFARKTQLNMNSIIGYDFTPFMYAIHKRSFNIVKHLLDFYNIDVDSSNTIGETALTLALRSAQKYLIIDIVNARKERPSFLDWTIASQNDFSLQILTIRFGAPPILFSESKKGAKIPLPALKGDYFYAIDPTIQNPVAFKRIETKGDGNCSFSAMETTRDFFCSFMVGHFENLKEQSQHPSASPKVKENFIEFKKRVKYTIFYTLLEDFIAFTDISQLEEKERQYTKMFQQMYSIVDCHTNGKLSSLIGIENPLQKLIKIFVTYKKTQLTGSEEEAKQVFDSFHDQCDDYQILSFLQMLLYGSKEDELDHYKLWPDQHLCILFSEAQRLFPDKYGITTRYIFWSNVEKNKLTCIHPESDLDRNQLLFMPRFDQRVINIIFRPDKCHYESSVLLGNSPELIHQLCISDAMENKFSSMAHYKDNNPALLEALRIIFEHLNNNSRPHLIAKLETSIRGLFDAGLTIDLAEKANFSSAQLDYLKKLNRTKPAHPLSDYLGGLPKSNSYKGNDGIYSNIQFRRGK